MRVISKARLRQFWELPGHEDSEGRLRAWYTHVNDKSVAWQSWSDIKANFASASIVGNCVAYNIGGPDSGDERPPLAKGGADRRQADRRGDHARGQRQLQRHCDPREIRSCGVVVRSEEALERRSGVIGYFDGRKIYASVSFMGMEYRFDRVTGPAYRRSVHERELYLHPGLGGTWRSLKLMKPVDAMTAEGRALVATIKAMLRQSLEKTLQAKIGAVLARDAFEDFRKRVDYTEYGGAPLLGVKGVCLISHGKSNSNAIKNAVRVAAVGDLHYGRSGQNPPNTWMSRIGEVFPLSHLRISLLDRCNFRCPYCMPESEFHPDFQFLKKAQRGMREWWKTMEERGTLVGVEEGYDAGADDRVLPAEELPDSGAGIGDDRVRAKEQGSVRGPLQERPQGAAHVRRDADDTHELTVVVDPRVRHQRGKDRAVLPPDREAAGPRHTVAEGFHDVLGGGLPHGGHRQVPHVVAHSLLGGPAEGLLGSTVPEDDDPRGVRDDQRLSHRLQDLVRRKRGHVVLSHPAPPVAGTDQHPARSS